MSQEPTPWETAAEYLGRSVATVNIIKEACEAHAKAVAADRDRLAAQLKLANEDTAEDDTKIRDLCRPILGDAAVDGDSYGVPSIVTLVELLIARLASKLKNATEDSILHEWAGDKIDAENAALRAQVKRLRETLNAVLLWHSGSPWTEVKKMQWWNLTQTEEATTRILCDTVRLALGKLPSCFGDFTGKLPTDIPSDMQLSHEQRNALEHLADTQQEAGA